MALVDKKTPKVTIGPVMGECCDGPMPPNPAELLRTGPIPIKTSPYITIRKPCNRVELVNLYRRNEPSPEDVNEPPPSGEVDS